MIHHILLAQSVDNVAADWIKNCALFLGGLAATVYYVKQIFWGDSKTKTELQQPVEISINEELHERFVSKSDFHEFRDDVKREILLIWETVRKEDADIRKDLNEKFLSIQRLLGRIEQKIDSHL